MESSASAFLNSTSLKEEMANDVFHLVPTIAIEVISPNDLAEQTIGKILFYLENGSRLVWVISPQTRRVTVYRRNKTGNLLREGDTLDGEDVLPNFRLPLEKIFGSLSEVEEN